MKIGLLEWICGGGLCHVEAASIGDSLRTEGWGMLSTVANDLTASGHDVSLAIDQRLVSAVQIANLRAGCRVIPAAEQHESLPIAWWEIASSTDATLIIAPELDGALETAIGKLKPISKLLCNCAGEFLANSCDKWRTAKCFARADIPHPATQLLSQVTPAWLLQCQSATRHWIIKPRDGAGCEGIRVLDQSDVLTWQDQLPDSCAADRWIVQPFLDGVCFSRSALVGNDGRACWLPLVSQEFLRADKMVYRGGEVIPPQSGQFIDKQHGHKFSIHELDMLLDSAIASLGPGAFAWVSFDLLFVPQFQQWLVIEANPRLTTSLTGLTISGGQGLMDKMLQTCLGQACAPTSHWQATRFYV